MPRSIMVHFLPEWVAPQALAGECAVVVDVLRASTTIVHALASGAESVIPCLEIEDAVRAANSMPGARAVLGGERGGLPIARFQLGNSPAEYTPESVGGRRVVFTTTNGTKALLRCCVARRVIVGALVNAAAVASALANEHRVHILCAGTRGSISLEDVMAAGCLVERFASESAADELDDSALVARNVWRSCIGSPGIRASMAGADRSVPQLPMEMLRERLTAAMRQSHGGRNLMDIGLADDIRVAAMLDAFDHVPVFDPAERTIRLA